jgi:hypothetical protein
VVLLEEADVTGAALDPKTAMQCSSSELRCYPFFHNFKQSSNAKKGDLVKVCSPARDSHRDSPLERRMPRITATPQRRRRSPLFCVAGANLVLLQLTPTCCCRSEMMLERVAEKNALYFVVDHPADVTKKVTKYLTDNNHELYAQVGRALQALCRCLVSTYADTPSIQLASGVSGTRYCRFLFLFVLVQQFFFFFFDH